MVRLLSHGEFVVDINEDVINIILDIYPDENLHERKVFKNALNSKEITFADLTKECSTLHIPWQLFLLSIEKTSQEVSKINNLRKSKFDFSKIANRASFSCKYISMRLLDRIIALQQFAKETTSPKNQFCNALTRVDRHNWVPFIIRYFDIDLQKFSDLKKEKALEYIINLLEAKNICVSRGVLANKVLPISPELRKSYKQSSGFVVQDNTLPYIFLPNEINRDETAGRQIYTLISLLILIGLSEYNILVNSDFESRINGSRLTKKIHGAVTEFLLPFEVTEQYKNKPINPQVRDALSEQYKLTPTAVVITLRERGLIDPEECEKLLNSIPKKPSSKDSFFKQQKLTTSVEKFCGKTTNANIKDRIHNKTLETTRAQYLLFGQIDKPRFHKFKIMSGL